MSKNQVEVQVEVKKAGKASILLSTSASACCLSGIKELLLSHREYEFKIPEFLKDYNMKLPEMIFLYYPFDKSIKNNYN